MALQLLGNRVGVEKLKKSPNKSDFLIEVSSEEYCGIVKYVGENVSLTLGTKVYFATKFQTVRMGGTELCVMDVDNVLAVESES